MSRRSVVLAVVGALVLGVGAVAVLGWCSVLGCTFAEERFEPDGAQASRARTDALAGLDRQLGVLSGGRTVLARASSDDCLRGQNNWKVKDTYSHECFVRESRVVVLAHGEDEVEPALDAYDRLLRDQGCVASLSGGLSRVRAEYWSPDNPNVAREGAAGLPMAAYDCPDGSRVETRPTAASATGADADAVLGRLAVGPEVLGGSGYDEEAVTALRDSKAALALVVTASRGYYRTTF